MIKIYHNPRCKKSREGLKYLEEKGLEFEIVDYIKESLSVDELSKLIDMTGLQPEELVRKQEEDYKKNYKGKSFSKEEWVKILVENPKLLQRPIVVNESKAVWAQPPDNIAKII